MPLALKIDVDTLRGTLEGVPRLAALLSRLDINATFLFSLGPDHTGRALRRLFRPGFVNKVRRTSVANNYGLKTLCYGTLLPGPDIGKRAGEVMRGVQAAGFEVGIHSWDHVRWQDYVARRGSPWTRREMQCAADRFSHIFGGAAKTIGAAGWQMNAHAFALEEELGFDYASDTRGSFPFMPAMSGRRFSCPQLPTTLPTLDELFGRNGVTEKNVADRIFRISEGSARSSDASTRTHVFTLHAELEGMAYAAVFERLLRQWRDAGFAIGSMRDLLATIDIESLPTHEVISAEVPGRAGGLAVQATA